jgi:hypothetical protein
VGALRVKPISKLLDAGAAAGAGSALAPDLGDRARPFVDDRIDVAVRGRVTQADEHRF